MTSSARSMKLAMDMSSEGRLLSHCLTVLESNHEPKAAWGSHSGGRLADKFCDPKAVWGSHSGGRLADKFCDPQPDPGSQICTDVYIQKILGFFSFFSKKNRLVLLYIGSAIPDRVGDRKIWSGTLAKSAILKTVFMCTCVKWNIYIYNHI